MYTYTTANIITIYYVQDCKHNQKISHKQSKHKNQIVTYITANITTNFHIHKSKHNNELSCKQLQEKELTIMYTNLSTSYDVHNTSKASNHLDNTVSKTTNKYVHYCKYINKLLHTQLRAQTQTIMYTTPNKTTNYHVHNCINKTNCHVQHC